ncbi:MAG: argininosuccinate lyase [Phycisphaerales bacterium]|nr:argininosuccinate lyase [Phycisphaerales bacterium]
MWGGRFEGASDPLFRALNDSLPFDHRLVRHDLQGSIAWARALAGAGALAAVEAEQIISALGDIGAMAASNPRAVAEAGDEDVHSWVESRLIERVGALGKKLHTGRSRNDQVATDLRLYVREECLARVDEIRRTQDALVGAAERWPDAPFPGYTHLQPAQPTLFAHWCLAHFEALDRDADRFLSARARAGLCPLGSGALTGTTFPVDRESIARELGFDGPTRNSLDAVSDRDFVVDALHAAALCAVHLSRFAEDLIIYSTAEFSLVTLSDAVTSGSSLMPQKKNPDALELLRGKSGRITGALVALLTTLKGLPLAYNKDLQEDKEPLFDALRHLSLSLRAAPVVLDGLTLHTDACARAAAAGYSNATELADYLVRINVPFRDAHEVAGRIVRFAIERGQPLEAIDLADFRRFAPAIGPDIHEALTIQATLARRNVPGGTAPGRVQAAVTSARLRLATKREQEAAR